MGAMIILVRGANTPDDCLGNSYWFMYCNVFRNMLHKDSDEARRQLARQGLGEG